MFDNNDQNQQAAATTAPVPADTSAPAVDTTAAPAVPADTVTPSAPVADQSFNATPLVSDPIAAPVPDASLPADPIAASTPALPVEEPTAVPDLSSGISLPADPAPVSDSTTPFDVSTLAPSTPAAPATEGSGDLLSIKQDALQNLSPLLSQLDQSPEEKFRTTMMLIQASDDQSLIQAAYAAAKEISDEKVRAQALLDIVNEINYFTQSKPAA